MVNKYRFILFILIFSLCNVIFAQNSTQTNNEEPRFKQKISWEKDNNAIEYKVELELLRLDVEKTNNSQVQNSTEDLKKTDSTSSENEQSPEYNPDVTWMDSDEIEEKSSLTVNDTSTKIYFTTRETYVEFSMSPGLYRYRIYTFDFLGRQSSVSEWQSFKITRATTPIIDVKQSNITIKRGSKETMELPVELEDIEPESIVKLINTKNSKEITGELVIEYTDDTKETVKSAKVIIPPIKEGEWKMVVTNPSGLKNESSVMDFDYLKKGYRVNSLYFQGGIGFAFPLPDAQLFNYNQKPIFPTADFRIGYCPLQKGPNSFGFEFGLGSFYISMKNDIIDLKLPSEQLKVNFVYQLELYNQMLYLNAKGGTGFGFTQEILSKSLTEQPLITFTYLSLQGGVYLMYIPYKNITLELGEEVNLLIIKGKSTSYLNTVLSIGKRL